MGFECGALADPPLLTGWQVAEDVATKLDVKGYPSIFFLRDGEADE